jgi:hypothetical protein
MSYLITRYNGQAITTVTDGTIDTSLDIKLIGKSYAGYGQAQNENFVYLLTKLRYKENVKTSEKLVCLLVSHLGLI